ncbi:hypothetical protein JTB14_023836 [Gonioctena quinquepunctata]|nr:hypothetical protein JTB14_023836 [Gonioctena quinquepunctata]
MMSRTSLNKFESLVVFFQLKVTRTILSESHFLATLESCPESDQYISKPQVKISHKSMDASLVEPGLNISEDHFLKRRLIFLDETMRAQLTLGPTLKTIFYKSEKHLSSLLQCGQLSYTFHKYKGITNYLVVTELNKDVTSYVEFVNCGLVKSEPMRNKAQSLS